MFVLFAGVVLLLYIYLTRNHKYWEKRNVKSDRPIPIFGNHFRNIFGQKSITQIADELYKKYPNEKVVGYYAGNTPVLVIRDPDLVRQILNVDFAYFYLRGIGRNPDIRPMMLNLFNVDGDKWKLLRQRLTPAFTTNKLKNMFPLVVRCAEKLQANVEMKAAHGELCDVRELMARFTTEFIGACGFGIEMDTINDNHSAFREIGRLIFAPMPKTVFYYGLTETFPILAPYLSLAKKGADDKLIEIFIKIREQRNFKPIGRNDFVDLLLELEAKGTIRGESIEKRNDDGTPVQVEMELDILCMAAQLFVFFAAGFETSSSATSFTLHQLAFNPEIQNKVQEEIDEVLIKYNNKLSYDAIAEMSLLDMAFKESMRIFPSLGVLHRVCAKKYTIPGTEITIDPEVKIVIPIEGIQNDEKYFDNPTEFRPERFLPEHSKERHHFVYLPFGEGPRACIGTRLGQMQSLAGLAAVLQQFSVSPAPSTPRTLTVNPKSNVVQGIQGGVPLLIKKRKTKTL